MSQNSQQVKYFNLHTTGLGYLNNIRLVEPKKGTPFKKENLSTLAILPH